jgi:hypothetical protein
VRKYHYLPLAVCRTFNELLPDFGSPPISVLDVRYGPVPRIRTDDELHANVRAELPAGIRVPLVSTRWRLRPCP